MITTDILQQFACYLLIDWDRIDTNSYNGILILGPELIEGDNRFIYTGDVKKDIKTATDYITQHPLLDDKCINVDMVTVQFLKNKFGGRFYELFGMI